MSGNPCTRLMGAAAALLLLAGPAAAQTEEVDWLRNCERQAERSDRARICELRLASGSLGAGALDVDAGPNGGIVVRGGDVRQVEVTAAVQVQAETHAAAQAIASAVDIQVTPGRVRSTGPQMQRGENWSVTFYITVPRRVDLELSTENGPVSVRDVTGRVNASTINGPLSLENLAGDVRGRTKNGPLRVALSGSGWEGAGLDAETINGPVNLSVPPGYSAMLEGGTDNGPVNMGLPIEVRPNDRRSFRFATSIGRGGAPIRVVTTNGPYNANQR